MRSRSDRRRAGGALSALLRLLLWSCPCRPRVGQDYQNERRADATAPPFVGRARITMPAPRIAAPPTPSEIAATTNFVRTGSTSALVQLIVFPQPSLSLLYSDQPTPSSTPNAPSPTTPIAPSTIAAAGILRDA